MRIREAAKDDVSSILRIFNDEVVAGVNAFDTEPVAAHDEDDWFAQHRDTRYPVILAENDQQLLGWASLSPWARHGAYARTAEVSVFVHRDQRGKGVGRALLQRIADLGRLADHHVLLARVEATNAGSRKLFRSTGYSPVGIMHEVGFKHGRYLDVELLELVFR